MTWSAGGAWLGAVDEIETEYVTVETLWSEAEQQWKTYVLVSADVLREFKNHHRVSKVLDSGNAVSDSDSRGLHKLAVHEVYRGAYRGNVREILLELEPVDVQEDVSER